MHKITFLYVLICSIALSACTSTHTRIKQITSESIGDAKTTMVGFTAPQPTWQCTLMERQSYNWSAEQFKAQFHFLENGYTMIKKKALEYAKEKKLDINYIFLDIPDELQVGRLKLTVMSSAFINYLKCEYPPITNNNIL